MIIKNQSHWPMTDSTIHIATAADDGYLPHAVAMLCSLFDNNPAESFQVHFLYDSESGIDLSALTSLCERYSQRLNLLAVTSEESKAFPTSTRYPKEIWFRYLLPKRLPGIEQILWLDADTIIRAPIRPLWESDLQGHPIAAVPCALRRAERSHAKLIGLNNRLKYFNSGILILQLANVAKSLEPAQVNKICASLGDRIAYPDQDVLNIAFEGQYYALAPTWNMVSSAFENDAENIRVHGRRALYRARANPAIVHYTGHSNIKPWLNQSNHPWRATYLQYRQLAGCPLADKQTTTLKKRIRGYLPMRLWIFLRNLRRRRYAQALESIGLNIPWREEN